MKVAFYTLGCKVNQSETASLQKLFKEDGFLITPFEEKADIYVINTCSVTAVSDKKSRQIVSRAKSKNENAVLVVCGCSVQNQEENGFEKADILLGSNDKKNAVHYVREFIKSREKTVKITPISQTNEFEDLGESERTDKTRMVLKIEDGCENFCAYCIIPHLRGKIRSKPPEKIIDEIKKIALCGYNEVVLTGIHLTSYGKDLESISLIELLEQIDSLNLIKRIRLGSLEPKYLNKDRVKRLKSIKSLCPHFHLSLQSGCDETLKRMNRKYTAKDYEKEVLLLRECFDNPSITTDIIVGFPSENDEEFKESASFFEKMAFSSAHIFPFSKRKGTPAYSMDGQITEELKKQRSKILEDIAKKSKENYQKSFLGKCCEVLFEKEKENGIFEGYTREYLRVVVKESENLEKKICTVQIKDYKDGSLIGQIV